MLIFRWLLILLLLVAGALFAAYTFTAQTQYRQWGWTLLKAALLAMAGFFALLILERLL